MPSLAAAAPVVFRPPPTDRQAGLAPGAVLRGQAGGALDSFNAAGAMLLGRRSPLVEAAAAAAGGRDPARLGAAALDALAQDHSQAEAAALTSGGVGALDAAVAAVRAATGRTRVLDLASIDAPSLAQGLARGDVAAVLARPLSLDGDARARLHEARRLCDRHLAALVVDERLTAPRLAAGGVQALWRIGADLAVHGPALANGRPLGALTGRAELVAAARRLRPDAFHPTPEALAALGATAVVLRHAPVRAVLQVRGSELQAELEAALAATGADRFARVEGDPTAVRLAFAHPDLDDAALRRFVQRELWRDGVLLRGRIHVSYAWADAEVTRMVDACRAAFAACARSVAVWERCRPVAA